MFAFSNIFNPFVKPETGFGTQLAEKEHNHYSYNKLKRGDSAFFDGDTPDNFPVKPYTAKDTKRYATHDAVTGFHNKVTIFHVKVGSTHNKVVNFHIKVGNFYDKESLFHNTAYYLFGASPMYRSVKRSLYYVSL